MKTPLISIVIPSYNKVKYIGKTLESIVTQSYKKIEVIIQDGGSTDGTLEIIKKYCSKFPSLIVYETKKDKGQLDAVNKGMLKTTGELITFINADDCYEQGALEKVAKSFERNPKSLWFAGMSRVVDEKDQEIAKLVTWYKNILLKINNYNLLLITNYMMQPSVFITKAAFNKYGPFTGTDEFIMEYDMWLRLGKYKMPVILKMNLSKFRIEYTTKTKRIFKKLLIEDEKLVNYYTTNIIILILHKLHNIGRIFVEKFV